MNPLSSMEIVEILEIIAFNGRAKVDSFIKITSGYCKKTDSFSLPCLLSKQDYGESFPVLLCIQFLVTWRLKRKGERGRGFGGKKMSDQHQEP